MEITTPLTAVEAEQYLLEYLWVNYRFQERLYPDMGSMNN